MEDLRALIEETVRREFAVLHGDFGVLRKEMDVTVGAICGESGTFHKEMDSGFVALRKQMAVRFEVTQKEMNARFEALASQYRTIRWMLGVAIALLVAILASHVVLFVLVVNIVLSEDRSGTPLPPPPNATVQAPAGTETAPPTGAVLGSEAPEGAAPGEQSATADPPEDQPTP